MPSNEPILEFFLCFIAGWPLDGTAPPMSLMDGTIYFIAYLRGIPVRLKFRCAII